MIKTEVVSAHICASYSTTHVDHSWSFFIIGKDNDL